MKAVAVQRSGASVAPATKPPQATPARAVSVQRFAGARSGVSADPSPLVDQAMAGASTGLDPATRGFMEPRFGYDFSQVRVHANASSGAAARALGAKAFTIGDHIFLGADQRAPVSGGDRRLLAHELTHVVQQRSGAVEGAQRFGELTVSDPGDAFERAAETSADAVMSADRAKWPAKGARPTPIGARVAGGTVQRFLAGEEGHGGIEESALKEAGFSGAEAHETYYGNWLRDWSQIRTDDWTSEIRLEFIKVIATGEFGHTPTSDEIGRYLASEHVDRPDGGDSPETPGLDPKEQAARRSKLSSSQQRWFDQEQSADFQSKIAAAAAASGLPAYTERAKAHAKQQIAEAARLGRNEAGERALGDGLHAVEDYFAHSNFVEVALAELADNQEVARDNPMVRALGRYDRVDPAKVNVDAKGRPGIVTGTSSGDAATSVGLMETIKAELKTPQIRSAFLRGAAIRYGWNAPRSAGRTALGAVGGVIGGGIGAVGGAVGGLVSGAGKGAAAGWRGAKHWWSKPFAAIGGLFKGAVTGAGSGAAAGAKAGWNVGKKVGGAAGEGVGAVAGLALTPAVYAAMEALYLSVGVPATIVKSHDIDKKIKAKSRETVDPKDKLNPTHSQIAKDEIDHPLHALAARLAHVVDVDIGRTMIEVWAGRRPVSDAQRAVDDYLVHPAASDWWKNEVRKAAVASAAPKKAKGA